MKNELWGDRDRFVFIYFWEDVHTHSHAPLNTPRNKREKSQNTESKRGADVACAFFKKKNSYGYGDGMMDIGMVFCLSWRIKKIINIGARPALD